jgi:hypothetical protein
MEKQTAAAVVRDYLQAWRSLSAALDQNRAELLDPNFAEAQQARSALESLAK